jgi:hypothetical protein
MVDEKTLARCCDMVTNQCVIARDASNYHIYGGWYRVLVNPNADKSFTIRSDCFRKAGLSPDKFDRLVWDALSGMNRDAVNSRYREDEGETLPYMGKHKYFYRTPAMAAARVKAAQELIYQCCEGHVPETDILKLFEETMFWECKRIVEGMPVYETA